MNIKKYNLLILVSVFSALNVSAQQFGWKAGYLGFLDNREYDNIYSYDQTMFGSRLSMEGRALLDERNNIGAGIDYLYEFGSKGELIAPDIILYFNGSYNKFRYSMGVFPRYGKLGMPLALLTDTLNYYRPNVEGIFIEYKTSGFRHNLWVDWTGRRSEITRESFTLGLSGYFNKGLFVYSHHLVINHLAHTEPKTPGVSLRDNAGYSVMAGVNMASFTGLDSLVLTTGVLGSFDRLRGEYDMRSQLGWVGEIEARYKRLGLHGMVYSGRKQFITSGDKSYQAGFYTRADAYYQVTNKLIDSYLKFSYHFLPESDEFSVQFVLRVQIEGLFERKLNN